MKDIVYYMYIGETSNGFKVQERVCLIGSFLERIVDVQDIGVPRKRL